MKNNIKLRKKIIGCCLLAVLVYNCADDGYLTDDRKANPYYNGDMMQYLESRPDYLKGLVEVIRPSGIEDVFKDERITPSAPTNQSIRGSFNYLSRIWCHMGHDSIKSFNQIGPEAWHEMLSMYIVRGKYLLKDIPQIDTTAIAAYPGQAFLSYDQQLMNMDVVYYDADNVKYVGAKQIIYSYAYDFAIGDMKNTYVTTSDVQPTNEVVRVLGLTDHASGFEPYLFATKAINATVGAEPDS